CFQDLGVREYMWDWEGKHADAAVIDRLFSDHYDYFAKHQLGRDKFLTFRIPNIWEEKGYNLLQAMTAILSGEDFARDLQFGQRPLFEVILPMTERPEQLMRIHTLFEKLARFKSTDFTKREPDNDDYLELIPLVEDVDGQLAIGELLARYTELHREHFGRKPHYIRPFLAGSDSALSSGFLAGIIGNKIGLSRSYEFARQHDIPVYPIFGFGSLLFRGGLSPADASLDRFIAEFPGARTVTVQSSFRYDHSQRTVKAAIKRLEQELPTVRPRLIASDHQKQLIHIAHASAALYKRALAGVANDMQPIFKTVPRRRDRRQHIGLLAYSRSMGEQTLPRAITFTAGFYSIGVPPEFIGLGRTLRDLKPGELGLLQDEYPHLATDLAAAGRFLNKGNLAAFAADNPAWQDIKTDVEAAEAVLGTSFGPRTKAELEHQALSTQLTSTDDPTAGRDLITKMAELRKSLG
ncbi:MAG TPA: phosphoenolpyruvate carboxylase, partial [Candidatus Saccharimonadales bacterium]|nr:phosphoenolpyruvate carboxylase [Candidatus Saccharimonadales bacterium]